MLFIILDIGIWTIFQGIKLGYYTIYSLTSFIYNYNTKDSTKDKFQEEFGNLLKKHDVDEDVFYQHLKEYQLKKFGEVKN
jgi:hypothetical protein